MKFSLFSNARATKPTLWEGTWEEFCETLGPHEFTNKSKEELKAFSPAEYPEGITRARENVRAVHALVLDIDQKTEAELRAFEDTAQGLQMLLYTTYSNAKKPFSVRAVIPLSRPVLAAEWPAFWNLTSGLFDNIGDPQCRDASRLYFGAFAPKGTEEKHFFKKTEGVPIDVDGLVENPPPDLPPPQAVKSEAVTSERLKTFAKKLSRKTDDKLSNLGDVLEKVCDGEVFAEPGTRDSTIFALSNVIAKRFPDGDPANLAEHFRRSISLMGDDCPSVQTVEYKIERAQTALRKEKVKQEQDENEGRRDRIREAFGGKRTEVYTDEELTAFGRRPKWIVQKGKSFYFLTLEGYRGPFTDADAGNAALIELAPAPVELWRTSRQGEVVRKSCNMLVAEYGTVALDVKVDMRVQKTMYDVDTRTIIEAPCPLRKLDAVYHPEIDKWLQLMVGDDKYNDLKTWIAAVTLLDVPCVALFLTGPKGTGKSLLALGLARLWTTGGPTTLAEALSDFNESVARCPLCFADETLPKDFKGYTKNGELREHIQAMVRPFKRKFLPNTSLLGATRDIIAANNQDILRTQENLSNNDIGAIVDRFMHISTNLASTRYLDTVDTREWVESDKIAQHALWLRDNHEWKSEGRFLIKVRDEQLSRSLATRAGDRSAVCQWLVGYLTNPREFDDGAEGNLLVRVSNGRLCVNTQGVVDCWTMYVSNEKCPPTGRLSTAIAALSEEGRAQLNNEEGVPTNYRIIDKANLITWARDTGYATEKQVEAALRKDTNIRIQDPDPKKMPN